MGLFGHMRIHESGVDRSAEPSATSNISTLPSPTLASSPCPPIATVTTTTTTSVADADLDTANYSCPIYDRTFISHIGLVAMHVLQVGMAISPPKAAPLHKVKKLSGKHALCYLIQDQFLTFGCETLSNRGQKWQWKTLILRYPSVRKFGPVAFLSASSDLRQLVAFSNGPFVYKKNSIAGKDLGD
ncbi:hypothetical protein SprV_0100481600 [Sparganum proliferum]